MAPVASGHSGASAIQAARLMFSGWPSGRLVAAARAALSRRPPSRPVPRQAGAGGATGPFPRGGGAGPSRVPAGPGSPSPRPPSAGAPTSAPPRRVQAPAAPADLGAFGPGTGPRRPVVALVAAGAVVAVLVVVLVLALS